MELGKRLRLGKLRNSHGFFFFLAADHQLTRGRMRELDGFPRWLELVQRSPGLNGIVVNIGSLRHIPPTFGKEVIPQLMGAPSPPGGDSLRKVRVGSVVEALRHGANLISTQLNFEDPTFLEQVELFQSIREEAGGYGLPTMIMVNLLDKAAFNTKRFLDYLIYSSELGGDLIKVNLPSDAAIEVQEIRRFVERLPPVVLSGDDKRSDFGNQVALSKACGFSGLCIGRNIFKHEAPDDVVAEVCTIYKTKS